MAGLGLSSLSLGLSARVSGGASGQTITLSIDTFSDSTDTANLITNRPAEGKLLWGTTETSDTLTYDSASKAWNETTLEDDFDDMSSLFEVPTTATTGDGPRRLWLVQYIGNEYSNVLFRDYTADNTAPEFSNGSPADDATGVAVDSALVLTFDGTVEAGTGNFYLRNVGGAVIETFNIATGSGDNGGTVGVSGTDVTITPGADMPASTALCVRWDSGVVQDAHRNGVAANSTDTLYNFTTASAGPQVSSVDVASSSINNFRDATIGATTADDEILILAQQQQTSAVHTATNFDVVQTITNDGTAYTLFRWNGTGTRPDSTTVTVNSTQTAAFSVVGIVIANGGTATNATTADPSAGTSHTGGTFTATADSLVLHFVLHRNTISITVTAPTPVPSTSPTLPEYEGIFPLDGGSAQTNSTLVTDGPVSSGTTDACSCTSSFGDIAFLSVEIPA